MFVKRNRKKSVLKNYLFAFLGLAVVVCALLGIVMISMSSNALDEKETASLQDRIESACDDFCYQMESMKVMALKTRFKEHFQPQFLHLSPYNDITMLDEFQAFSSYCVLTDQCFLYYDDSQKIYASNSMTTFAGNLFEDYYFENNSLSIVDALHSNAHFVPCNPKNTTMRSYFYVTDFYFNASKSTRAFMLYLLDSDTLQQRYGTMFKLSNLSIRADDILLLGEDSGSAWLSCTRPCNGFQITFFISEQPSASSPFLSSMLAILIGLSVFFALVAIVLAYRQYIPIKQLAGKMGSEAMGIGNEIQNISNAVDEVIRQKSASMLALTDSLENISRLRDALKQQIILLALSGEYDPSLEKRMADADMDLSGEHFCVAHIALQPGITHEALKQQIRKMDDWDTKLYLAQLSGSRGWALLFCGQSDENLLADYDTVLDELSGVFPNLIMRHGDLCSSIQKIAYSLAVAESLSAQGGNEFSESTETGGSDFDLLQQIQKRIHDGSESEALDLLDMLLKELDEKYPSALFRRYRLVEIVYKLIEFAKDCGVILDEEQLKASLTYIDTDSVREMLSDIIRKTCAVVPHNLEALPPACRAVIDYITEHSTDADVCLDSVATAFSVSTKQISRITRSITGMSFKEYVFNQRMHKAMQLLKQGLTSTDTALQVGYSDVSYFTKVFRSYAGCTPGQYREKYCGVQHFDDKDAEER